MSRRAAGLAATASVGILEERLRAAHSYVDKEALLDDVGMKRQLSPFPGLVGFGADTNHRDPITTNYVASREACDFVHAGAGMAHSQGTQRRAPAISTLMMFDGGRNVAARITLAS